MDYTYKKWYFNNIKVFNNFYQKDRYSFYIKLVLIDFIT